MIIKSISSAATVVITGFVLLSPSMADEKRTHANAGSFWNYAVVDEIKQTKWLMDTTVTEVKEDEHVLRFNTRGNSNNTIQVYAQNWNLVESPGWKYEPHLGTGVPSPLNVGSQSRTDVSFIQQQQTGGWSDPRPGIGEARITAVETITTKAGRFETYRVESSSKFFPSPSAPLTETETKIIYWFSPKIDHWVKWQYEQRSGGRLVSKLSQELIEYKIR
jgi:hypothetical protein